MATANEETNWINMSTMSTPRQDFQTEVIDGKIYAIGGRNTSTLSSVEVYNPVNDTWTTLASMSNPRYSFNAEVIDGKIYAIGGQTNVSTGTTSVEVYDPAKNTWTTLASMSTPRRACQTAVVGGKIYAVGGQDITYLSSVEVYDPANNTWTTLASMSNPRISLRLEVIDNKIYAIGGGIDSIPRTVEVYDLSSNTWSTVASMKSYRSNFQTELIDGKIYSVGANKILEVYDPDNDTWTNLASMSISRTSLQTEVVNGKIYAIGGAYYSTAEVYELANDTWTSMASMSTPRTNFQTEVIDGKIYAIGGQSAVGGTSSLSSMEAYTVASSSAYKLKVVLDVNEILQLTIDNNINNNTNVTWTSSNKAVASVDENGVVTALTTGNATITVSDGNGYTDSINILVVENADAHRLAIDLHIGNTSRLTVDDYTNTKTATWASSDPSIATITNVGRVTAVSTGLTLITATDEDKNQIGQAYVRVRA